ncbi:wnt inhibitory factor 1-like [Dendronephthya gigantea]|uniref:wnt inhibitory factor 1-like n=1 Tax=Dendronephthya gigantea TaxID=151771 RepID=UPI00106B8894|nr:wnt inhibitory factor 1-like [Dendronephthya gigantea]
MVDQKLGVLCLIFMIVPHDIWKSRLFAEGESFQTADDNIDRLVALNRMAGQNTQKRSQACLLGCANGGTCVNGKCVCAAGYKGSICNERDCIPKCENGGTCRSGVCDCIPGYTGNSCEKPVCAPSCLNGGQCVAPDKCQCPSGWNGNRCEKAFCEKPCLNFGKCIQPNVCDCTTNYMNNPNLILKYQGDRCQTPICPDGCVGGLCLVNSTKSSDMTCECYPGYAGADCSVENDCEKTLDLGVSKHYLNEMLALRHYTAKNLSDLLGWSMTPREKDACLPIWSP